MKPGIILCFCCLLLFPSLLIAQEDSLREEIINYNDKRAKMISNGRRLMLDSFMEGDILKMKEVKDYLIGLKNEDYAVFHPFEYWMILYWTQDFPELLEDIRAFDSTSITAFQQKLKPSKDMLSDKLLEQTVYSFDQIVRFIKSTELSDQHRDILLLHSRLMVAKEHNPFINQDTLNYYADQFLDDYPESPYENFVRHFIRYKYYPSDWGFGFEFLSGFGLFTGRLNDHFRDNIPIGVAFDVEYRDLCLYLRDYIGFSKTKTDLSFNDVEWKNMSSARVFLPEASLGYVILENDKLKIAPFAGIAGTDIGPTDKDVDKKPELDDAGLDFTTTWVLGLNVDIKLGQPQSVNHYNYSTSNYGFIRLRYAYTNPRFNRKYSGISGNMHYITIGFGGFYSKLKREL